MQEFVSRNNKTFRTCREIGYTYLKVIIVTIIASQKRGGVVEQFGIRLRAVRKECGLTLEKLAEACNTSETVLRNYEKDRTTPNVEMLLRICEALEVSPDYLLQDELSFNPYEDKMELGRAVGTLSPDSLLLLRDFLLSLHTQ